MIDEKKAYEKADKLITANSQSEILLILNNNAENYKDVGTLLGKNFTEAFAEEINKAKNALDSLNKKKVNNNVKSSGSSIEYTGTSSSGSNYAVIEGGIVADKPFAVDEAIGIYDSRNSSDNSSSNEDGYTASSDGYSYKTETVNGETITYAHVTEDDEIAPYDTGGRTPSDIPDSGKLGILHKDEKILNANETVKFDESMLKLDKTYDYIKTNGVLLGQLLNSYSNVGSYTVPNIVSNDLNKIINSITTTNNNDNSNSNSININNTYQVDATSDFKTKNFGNNLTRQLKAELRSFGKI